MPVKQCQEDGKLNCICYNCYETFYEFPSRIKLGRGKFCSKDCFINYKRNHKVNQYTTYICKDCGRKIPVRKDHLKDRNLTYCRKCVAKRNGKSGKEHPNWKGGITSDYEKARAKLKISKWHHKIFKRDNYTCQICGDNKGGNLESHHIFSFINYPEERYNLDNGITLCSRCHHLIHDNKVGLITCL